MKTIRISIFLLFLFSINFNESYGQRNIKGRVIDDNLDELIGAPIFDEGKNSLGETNQNGFFDITIPKESNKLAFAYIGYEFANIELSDSCNYIEVILLPDAHYDFMSNREVDRLRKKEFDKLPQLHLNAVKKGIFTNETLCYSREFEPAKPRLDEISRQIKARKKQIKKDYQNLSVGDTIQIPFDVQTNYGNGTNIFLWLSLTDTEHFDCTIEGVVTKKYRNGYHKPRFLWISLEKGYNFTYRVTNCENCKYDSIVYNGKAMKIGQELEQDMKIFKTIIKKNASR